jgi:hypothetical protein
MTYATAPTGRTDTTLTPVEVTGVEGWTFKRAAARHVEQIHPGANVLAVWRSGARGRHGYAVWNVEWEGGE